VAASAAVGDTGKGGVEPPSTCNEPISSADTSDATTVGDGSPASCTESALDAALESNNGALRFDCGEEPHTITVTSEKGITSSLIIDGGGLITLGGGETTRILALRTSHDDTSQTRRFRA
jgi:hypothetical protein